MMKQLQPLSEEDTQAVCSQWLSWTAGGAQGAILRLLQACRDASKLAAAEAKLRAAIQDWKHTPQTGSLQAPGAQPAPCCGRPHPWCSPSLLSRLCNARTRMVHGGPAGSGAESLLACLKAVIAFLATACLHVPGRCD